MQDIIGSSFLVFLFLTLILFGGFAYMTGLTMADEWRTMRRTTVYAVLLAAADRFLVGALFSGDTWAPVPFLVTAALMVAIALLSFRARTARNMVKQYPWLYERRGLLGWSERKGA